MFIHIIFFIGSFMLMWYASRLILESVDRFSRVMKISAFAASFFILGMLTSLPEFFIGVNSMLTGEPEIFVGNLIGASFVLLVFALPLLAVLGNGINLTGELTPKNLMLSLIVVFLPVVFVVDGVVSRIEGLSLMVIYAGLFWIIEKKRGRWDRLKDSVQSRPDKIVYALIKLGIAAVLIFGASRLVVAETVYFARIVNVSPLLISLLLLSLGTNAPELIIGIGSLRSGKKTIAIGDYIGSAAFNSFLFGAFSFIVGTVTLSGVRMAPVFVLFLVSMVIFFLFARSKNKITRLEGLLLLAVYGVLILIEAAF